MLLVYKVLAYVGMTRNFKLSHYPLPPLDMRIDGILQPSRSVEQH
jgi:hypothetical protein